MRETKFRAWPKKELLQRRGISHATYDIFTIQELMSGTWHFEDYDRWEEYTGLKDKNGVEIYEGDIVKLITKNSEIVRTCQWEPTQTGFRFEGFDYYGDSRIIEVIGNIYENPELLK